MQRCHVVSVYFINKSTVCVR